MPFPSTGCQTCKNRRIKVKFLKIGTLIGSGHILTFNYACQCDETRPVCNRCQKSGRVCLGFEAGQGEFVFRDENVFASTSVPRPRGGARRLQPDAPPTSAEQTRLRGKSRSRKEDTPRSMGQPSLLGFSAAKTIARTLTPSLEVRAINTFLRKRVSSSGTSPITILDFL